MSFLIYIKLSLKNLDVQVLEDEGSSSIYDDDSYKIYVIFLRIYKIYILNRPLYVICDQIYCTPFVTQFSIFS